MSSKSTTSTLGTIEGIVLFFISFNQFCTVSLPKTTPLTFPSLDIPIYTAPPFAFAKAVREITTSSVKDDLNSVFSPSPATIILCISCCVIL
ncbi:MAG: hypothetical protein BWX59_02461 [Bacteroidetes bacterium ADurb.Bin028]|nr:MAG: hypothetical protein BWX59_02461 [Bacteroidetes bacterium ADurb.Bin028]